MKHIYDNKLIDQLVETHQIHLLFDTKDLTFQCLQYQKGDVLCSPLNPIGCLLFLISGSVQIYALHPDGWKMPVASISKAAGQMFGDMEFCSGKTTAFFVEATEETICLALPIQDYRERLYQDIRFLHALLQSVSEKIDLCLNIELTSATLEEKVLRHLEMLSDHTIRNVEETALSLRCSRRQLQRVLKKLCEDGVIQKISRGHYRIKKSLSSSEALCKDS